MKTITKSPTAKKIMTRIATKQPTTVGLLASDLDLSVDTVKRHVRAMRVHGLVETTWDGIGVELTAEGRAEMQQGPMDKLVQGLKEKS